MDPDPDAAELAKLPTDMLARIYHALHDCKDGALHEAIRALIWERHAVEGGDWPRREVEIGDPNADYPEVGERRRHWIVGYCAAGVAPTGRDGIDRRGVVHDPLHQVARRLYVPVRAWTFEGLQCTCGRRSDLPSNAHHLQIKWRQATADARVWPVQLLEPPGAGRPIPHFQVCRFAKTADDPDHAPNEIGMQCLCGEYLGRHHPDPTGPFDRRLPAF